jgi:hypothetical protein
MTGPFSARQGMVFDREDRVVLITAAGTDYADAERVAADLNLADSIHAEPRIETTLALHRRDGGETIRASAEFCAAVLPGELAAAISQGKTAATLLGIRTADVLQMRSRS